MSDLTALPRRVCVGVVTYNSRRTIAETLTSLRRAETAGLRIELLVRDNGSTDGTVELLKSLEKEIKGLRVLPGGENVGYGRGHNAILSAADCDVYIVCNPDILVPPDFFSRSAGFLDAHPDVGLMSPRMTFPDGRPQRSIRRHPTVWDLALRRFLPAALRGPFRARTDRYEMADIGYERPVDVPFCSGALMVCRTEALQQIGGFDDRYFLYFEDADLSRMMQVAGWRTVYNPEATVIHGWQRAAHTSLRMSFVFARNAVRYFDKWGWRLW